MKVVDVHCHIVPSAFPTSPPSCVSQWPWMDHRENRQAMVMTGKKEFRLVDSRCWDVERRIADMNEEDVGMQVVSPMPELLSYWFDSKDASILAKSINQAIAELINAAPGQFGGLGMVPLQDPELAAKELGNLRSNYGIVGVEIGSNINGKAPGDPFFDVFFAEAERLDLAVFVHAMRSAAESRLVGPAMLEAFIGYPTDVGLAAASIITGRVLEKFPKLRIGFSHGGGTLSAFLPRLESGWQKVPAVQKAFLSPAAMARKMYYDNITFNPHLLKYLIDSFGVSQIFAGSDYPFTAGQKFPGKPFDEIGLSADDLDAVRGGNAARFLNI